MENILQLTIAGIAMGLIYGLIGMGVNLVYNATGGLNFAQGSLVLLGAYMGVTFCMLLRLPIIIGILLALVAMAGVGVAFGKLVYEPVRKQGPQMFLMAAIGSGIAIVEATQIIWGKIPYFFPRLISISSVKIGGSIVDTQSFIILLCSVLILLGVLYLLRNTQLGLAMLSVGQDKEVAGLMGIRVGRTISLTFSLSTVLASVAGILVAPLFFVSPSVADIMIKGMCACVIGGYGPKVMGVIVGGVLLGAVESFAAFYISSAYRDAWAFLLLTVFLLVRPRGLFGREVAEKA
ncbi:MAG: branched-chain amino acid ABC transporter permease [Firmicutes bacterium]|nr:branched-chain amino acid ABC transporter permease [Bacillota bacterium]